MNSNNSGDPNAILTSTSQCYKSHGTIPHPKHNA